MITFKDWDELQRATETSADGLIVLSYLIEQYNQLIYQQKNNIGLLRSDNPTLKINVKDFYQDTLISHTRLKISVEELIKNQLLQVISISSDDIYVKLESRRINAKIIMIKKKDKELEDRALLNDAVNYYSDIINVNGGVAWGILYATAGKHLGLNFDVEAKKEGLIKLDWAVKHNHLSFLLNLIRDIINSSVVSEVQ